MARLLTVKDAHNIMNALVSQMTGQASESVIDSSSFVSAGESLLSDSKENTLNALSLLLFKTVVAVRPYNAQFASIRAIDTGVYSHRFRKISFYTQKALANGSNNTDLFTNFADGFTNGQNKDANGDPQSTKSMWEQNPAMPVEINFGGSSAWDDCLTVYEDKLEQAFQNENDFNMFISGIVTEKENQIEQEKEAFARMTVLNHMAGAYNLNQDLHNGMAYNMTKLFNDEMGTNYTTAELRTVYLADFMKFFTAKMEILKRDFADRDTLHHYGMDKTVDGVDYAVLRHTPANKFKGIFNSRFFTNAIANVFPTIFNEQYLNSGKGYELVNFWQSKENPLGISIEPAIPDITGLTGVQTKGAKVELDCVLGIVFDEDAIVVDYQIDSARTTPLEARKKYYNTWYTIQKNAISDLTEKTAIIYMADDAVDGASQLGVL